MDAHRPLATIDVGPLLERVDVPSTSAAELRTAAGIDRACRDLGFFRVAGHGIDPALLATMDRAARAFFALSDDVKSAVAMHHAGPAWRGWFPVGGELTAGRPDRKEGLYVGIEHPPEHPRVRSRTPLHGANLFPASPPELGPAVVAWIDALVPVARAVLRGMALALGAVPTWFDDHLTADPTVLFRIFHYPPGDNTDWGVAEHTDYGLLTLLAQDDCGGLQVYRQGDGWIDVPADPDVLVCNLGDMLDRLTEGRYRSTPHRVRNLSGRDRLSFPFFFDPSWDAVVTPLPIEGAAPPDDAGRRWDGTSVRAWDGTYGEYLTAKVSRVFPQLFEEVV